MSKGNLFLGMARGSVGDVTFTRIDGEQVARARNRAPKNPKTALQLLQRVVMKTISQAYSLMQEITDHSFQGFPEGTPNQSQFVKRNVAVLRELLADEINSGDSLVIMSSQKTNFANAYSSLPVMNPYVVSEGSIPALTAGVDAGKAFLLYNTARGTIPTYQELVDNLGLMRGDQLTFLCLSTNDDTENADGYGEFNGFEFARVILEPANGDMTVPFMVQGGSDVYSINEPNPRNEGNFVFAPYIVADGSDTQHKGVKFRPRSMREYVYFTNSIAACTVIASRLVGNIWTRSTQRLVLGGYGTGQLHDYNSFFLGDSIMSFLSSADSSLYLNQAESFK